VNKNNPKISIVVITYNQENSIGRALDSLLCQREFVYEIIVSDDCSIDKTWLVVQEYKKRFPDIIKPFRNDVNLGIFGNIEQTYSKSTGDIVFLLAGDDTFCDKIFEKTNELIFKNKIDFKNDAFLLFFDFMSKGINGEERIFRNSLVKKHATISLKIRRLINNRSMGMSQSVFKKHFPIDKSIGVSAEGLIDIQPHMFSEKAYYMPYVGSVYFSNIGVSTRLIKRENIVSYIKYLEILPQMMSSVNKLTKSDKKWIKFSKAKFVFQLSPSISNFNKYFFGLIMNTEFKFGAGLIIREYKAFISIIFRNLKTLIS
jgi:glycosyltransferase involved in cell wall biosynthesis